MLKRVSIQNFKSLKDVTLDLQKVNLLIGPNNSGKTNFLKAFSFINSFFYDEEKNLVDSIFYRRSDRDELSLCFSFENTLPEENKRDGAEYEHFLLHSTGEPEFNSTRVGAIDFGFSKNLTSNPNFIEDDDLKSIAWRYYTGFILLYDVDPNQLKVAYPLFPNNVIIREDASNMVAFLDSIRDKFPDNFYSIQEGVKLCIPEFTQLRFDTVEPDEENKKYFGDKTFKKLGLYNATQKNTYWADELSEGTLYFLALLCIVNQPNPPKLLLLEEPEKGIHPRRIYEIIQFIFRLAEDKDIQVIMTTHSPIVLDMFKDIPESVFIFDKDDEGATQVKNLQRDVIEPDTERSKEYGLEPPHYTDALGDSWTIGFLGGVPK